MNRFRERKRERERERTVTYGNCVEMPMFLYYDHTVNQDIGKVT